MTRRLKQISDFDFSKMKITVVNETPGSVREIKPEEFRGEMLRLMGKGPNDLLPWERLNDDS